MEYVIKIHVQATRQSMYIVHAHTQIQKTDVRLMSIFQKEIVI